MVPAVPTWAGVVRISHMGSRRAGDENVHADRDQLHAIEQHAHAHNARLVVLPPELDVSGGLPLEQRPSLLAAIQGVERGEYDAIVVAYLSRLGRSVREQLRAWDRVEAAGGKIIVVQEGIDTSTPTGRLQRTIMLGIAEHEREQHAERFENLRGWATTAGIWQRRQTPLGYTRDPGTRKLVANTDAVRVVRAFGDRLAGVPVSMIARDLKMTPSGVRALLRNRVYLGELRVGEHVNPAAHPALVDPELFEAVQHARITRPPKRSAHPALLAGLARCAGCGHVMARTGTAYACARHHSDGTCQAPAAITGRILDEHVTRIALHQLARLRTRMAGDEGRVRQARADVAAAERELAAYLDAVQAAGLAPDTFAAGARKRQAAITEVRNTLAQLVTTRPAIIDGDAVALWPDLDGTERNHLLCGLLEAVVVQKVGRGRVVPVAERVRVLRAGAGIFGAYGGGGRALPLVAVFPDADDEGVLGVPPGEDALEGGRG